MKVFLPILLLFLSINLGYAQSSKKITGKVFESNTQIPLPGVSILVKGTKTGTTTDQNGLFAISSESDEPVLIVSYLGFKTKELTGTSGSPMNISLDNSSNALNEVIVVAYGTASKASYVGSVSQIKSEQLANRQVSNVSKALQGMVPGVQVTSSSGQPGTTADIRIRGIGSINASSAPLYVVDGNPFSGDINSINVNDIESVSVLKDAASSALYGSRGANGVIIITTKSGKNSKETLISANFSQGVSNRAVKDYAQMNTNQYFESYWLALKNKQLTNGINDVQAGQNASNQLIADLGINPYGAAYPQPVGADGKIVTGAAPLWDDNWGKEMEQTSLRTQADLSFSGGNETTRYFISGGYLNDKGIALGSGYKRYNARINLTTQAKKWLKVGLNISASSSTQNYPTSEDSNTGNVINYSRLVPSFYPVYQRNVDGGYRLDASGNKVYDFGDYRPSSAIPRSNLAATVGLDKSEILQDNVSARTFMEADIAEGLKFKTSYSGDYSEMNDHYYTNPLLGGGAANGGSVSKSSRRIYSWTWNNIFTYQKTFNEDHHLNLLAGHEIYKYNSRSISGSRQNFVLPDLFEPDAAAQLNSFNGSSVDYMLLSFLGKAEYDFKNKYLLSASLRTDGSSRFSPARRWGTFWSVGASWRASKEDFLQDKTWLTNLTFRTSYGAQGNDNIGTYYAYDALYAIRNNLGENGVVTSRLPTPDLKWETNLNLNIGMDFGLFRDRISGSIEYFNRRSKDLLFSKAMPNSTGFSSIDANIGSLKNTGIEIQLNTVPISTTDFRWTFGINATYFKNKITDLPQDNLISGNKLLRIGGSIYDFYLREWAGVNPENGNPQWYKNNGQGQKVVTETYSEATQYVQKSALPDLVGGISNTFTYKQFELSALLSYSLGGKILDGDYTSMMHNGNSPGRTWSVEMLNHWTPENTDTNVPRLTTDNLGWTQTSTRFLYDATYARLKNVSLSYSLPKAMVSRMNINNLRFTLSGENLLTFYGHKGMDPEQTVNGATYFRYPAMRTFSAGVNLTF
ncbi:TonB-linked outer membrane protein, SusC/RagA family [Pedobacter antarcticus]|nr:TonB-dependent receptor [Pedobacter antarcticus]SFE42776.1 TonB-linked outer membrane protein, SusC/RagA family [Pedobacter antarcticus]